MNSESIEGFAELEVVSKRTDEPLRYYGGCRVMYLGQVQTGRTEATFSCESEAQLAGFRLGHAMLAELKNHRARPR